MNVHLYIFKALYLRDWVDDSGETIDENNDTNNGGREKPGGVEANPGEIDTNLLTKVAPACRLRTGDQETKYMYSTAVQ